MSKYFIGAVLYTLMLPAQATPALYESFMVKPKWKAFAYAGSSSPSIPSVAAVNGEMRVTIPYDIMGETFAAGYTSTCLFTGDFDVAIDYKLLSFPANNGVRVGLVANNTVKRQVLLSSAGVAWGTGAQIMRMSGAANEGSMAGELYATDINHDCCHPIPTAARTGKLRLIRSQGIVTGYYFDAYQNFWVEINNGGTPVSFGDTPIELAAWSHDSFFSDKNIQIAFDNFFISKGTLTGPECPTPQTRY